MNENATAVTEKTIQETKYLRGHIPSLDGIRGTAALLVFIFHYGGGNQSTNVWIHSAGRLASLCWLGVSLFFVLSGFLITGILWDNRFKRHNLLHFYTRRSLRIFPLYYLAITIIFLWNIYSSTVSHTVLSIWPFLIYLQNFPFAIPILRHLNPHLTSSHFWTLAVEEQFYLLWPVLLIKVVRSRSTAIWVSCGIFAISLIFRAWVFAHPASVGGDLALSTLPACMSDLAVGAFLALFLRGNHQTTEKLMRALPWLAGLLFVMIGILIVTLADYRSNGIWMALVGTPIFSLFFGSILLLSTRPGLLSTFFSSRPLRHLGTISYGVYVYHLLFRRQFDSLATWLWPTANTNGHLILVAGIAMAGTLLLANLSYYTFERYCLSLKERWAPNV